MDHSQLPSARLGIQGRFVLLNGHYALEFIYSIFNSFISLFKILKLGETVIY
jgi:hypothetical protein